METQQEKALDVITIDPDSSVFKARALMSAHEIRHVPVVDKDGRLIGIITDRDIRSAAPSKFDHSRETSGPAERFAKLKVSDVMTPDPHAISTRSTFQDVLVLFREIKVGAFPVVDEERRVVGIVSERDLLQSFIQILGIQRPGTFVGLKAGDKPGEMLNIVSAVVQTGVSIGSLLAIDDQDGRRKALFLYLAAKNVGPAKQKLQDLGYDLINPMDWFLGRFKGPFPVNAIEDDRPSG